VLSLLLAVTVASVLLPLLFSEKPKVTPPPSEVRHEVTPPPSEVKQTVTPPPPEVLPEVPPPPPKVKHEYPAETKHDTLHTLELFAEDTSWIFITIDDSESKEVLLHQGDRIKWSAKNIFSLKIGNAGGIKLIFDGKEIGPLGEEGQVVTLKLPPPTNSTSDTLETNSETE
jgi:hypothetical protein